MDFSEIKWTHKMTGRLIREGREHLGLSRSQLGKLSGLTSSMKKIEEAEDKEPVMAITDHKLRVFFASAGVAFLDGRMIVVHDWTERGINDGRVSNKATAPKGWRGWQTGRPLSQDQKAANYEEFLSKNKDVIDQFIAGDTLASIAARHGLSKERIRQVAKKAGLEPRRSKTP